MELLTAAHHPKDLAYRQKRHSIVHRELRGMSAQQVNEAMLYAASQPAPEGTKEMSRRILGELHGMEEQPRRLKNILDSTGGGSTGGSVLIRQDLEPYTR